MEFQTIKEKGKVKFVVLPVDLFEKMMARLEDDSDLRAIREAKNEPLYGCFPKALSGYPRQIFSE